MKLKDGATPEEEAIADVELNKTLDSLYGWAIEALAPDWLREIIVSTIKKIETEMEARGIKRSGN